MVEREPKDIDQQRGLARREDKLSLPIGRAVPFMEKIGFSPALPAKVRTLNDVLARIAPSRSVGFSMEIRPDATAPQIDFTPHVENPFKIEITGIKEDHAILRISAKEYLYRNGSLRFADVQQFVRGAFPDRQASLYAAPVLEHQLTELGKVGSRMPQDLYEEEKATAWRERIRDSKKRTTERLLDGLLPTIDVDLNTVTEEQIIKLSERIEAVKIDATFYSKWSENRRKRKVNRKEGMLSAIEPQLYNDFQVMLEGEREEEPLLQISLFPLTYGKILFVFQQLFYRGTPEEVEGVIEQFTEMMKKTPTYAESYER